MVELDIQLLVGAAVTVFLALIFFGVVVLWDVALALRSVGDKIDKLEDNIDDDLMDIAHALDGISNAPSNGGTQLHLSGGTISSGPAAGQERGQTAQGQQARQQQAGGEPSRQAYQHPQPDQQPSQAGSPGGGDEAGATGTEVSDHTDGADRSTDSEETSDDDPAAESAHDDPAAESVTDGAPVGDEGNTVHPRATRTRGRFVTSPDRTAWYATALDRDAIRAARPSIAGALTDGSETGIDDSEIIAVGPVESAEPAESAVPSDGAGTGSEDGTAETKSGGDSEPIVADERESGTRGIDQADESDEATDSPSSDAETFAFEEDEPNADADSSPTEPDGSSATDDSDDRDAEPNGQSTADTDPLEETDIDVRETEPDGEPGSLERPDDDSDALERTEPDEDETALERELDAESETAQDEPADPFGGDDSAFEFDGDIDDDVTVEEAVETINEDAPAPELSSHQFELTAEVYGSEDDDRDGAVLLFEFDTETVDISGSTKRLLQYQMRSFADRDATPDADVSIGRDRIVIEIHDSDGNAVQRWGEAAVGIIDRTLYLSDNSSDES